MQLLQQVYGLMLLTEHKCFVCHTSINLDTADYVISIRSGNTNAARYQHNACMRNQILHRLHQFIDGDIGGSCD